MQTFQNYSTAIAFLEKRNQANPAGYLERSIQILRERSELDQSVLLFDDYIFKSKGTAVCVNLAQLFTSLRRGLDIVNICKPSQVLCDDSMAVRAVQIVRPEGPIHSGSSVYSASLSVPYQVGIDESAFDVPLIVHQQLASEPSVCDFGSGHCDPVPSSPLCVFVSDSPNFHDRPSLPSGFEFGGRFRGFDPPRSKVWRLVVARQACRHSCRYRSNWIRYRIRPCKFASRNLCRQSYSGKRQGFSANCGRHRFPMVLLSAGFQSGFTARCWALPCDPRVPSIAHVFPVSGSGRSPHVRWRHRHRLFAYVAGVSKGVP